MGMLYLCLVIIGVCLVFIIGGVVAQVMGWAD